MLSLLRDGERHGYQIILTLKERIGGDYSPSAGTVYPRLRQLEQEGLVRAREEAGRVFYRLTGAGEEELRRRAPELEELEAEVGRSAQTANAQLRRDVHRSAEELRRELRRRAEALSQRPTATPFASDLEVELARFTSEWSRLVAGIGRDRAKEALRRALAAAKERLRDELAGPGPER